MVFPELPLWYTEGQPAGRWYRPTLLSWKNLGRGIRIRSRYSASAWMYRIGVFSQCLRAQKWECSPWQWNSGTVAPCCGFLDLYIKNYSYIHIHTIYEYMMYINVFNVSMVAAQESFHLPYCDIFHSSISKFGAATTRMSWDMNHGSLSMQGRFLCQARDAKDAQWLGAQHQRFGWRLVTSLAREIHREWGFKAMHLQVLVTLGDGEWCYCTLMVLNVPPKP